VAALASGRRSGSDGPRAGRAGWSESAEWLGCGLWSSSGLGRRDEGASVDFGELGRKRLCPQKGKEKGNSFSFSENISVKKNNLEIAR
jgi:hypothetical protein